MKCKNDFPRNDYWLATSHADVVKHADEMLRLALKVRRAWKRYHRFIADNHLTRANYVKWNIAGTVRRLHEAIRDLNIIGESTYWDDDTRQVALDSAAKIMLFISLPIGCFVNEM